MFFIFPILCKPCFNTSVSVSQC